MKKLSSSFVNSAIGKEEMKQFKGGVGEYTTAYSTACADDQGNVTEVACSYDFGGAYLASHLFARPGYYKECWVVETGHWEP